MAVEIERKFFVKNVDFLKGLKGKRITQGYLCKSDGTTVRLRIIDEDALLTVKGPTEGFSRLEYEFNIPIHDAEEMMEKLCSKPYIQKQRYYLPEPSGLVWEVDVFDKENKGLVIAEIELPSEETEFTSPDWLGKELTGKKSYYNGSLRKKPYSKWGKYFLDTEEYI